MAATTAGGGLAREEEEARVNRGKWRLLAWEGVGAGKRYEVAFGRDGGSVGLPGDVFQVELGEETQES
jgi:hypothetical protein